MKCVERFIQGPTPCEFAAQGLIKELKDRAVTDFANIILRIAQTTVSETDAKENFYNTAHVLEWFHFSLGMVLRTLAALRLHLESFTESRYSIPSI